MIGQAKLLNRLTKYTLSTLPKTMLYIGEKGSGRHTVIADLAKRLDLNIIEIDENTTDDDIISFKQDPIYRMYLIDISIIPIKQQAQFLKLIEEPSKYMYFSIIAETEAFVLNTILNRCVINYLAPYTESELRQIKDINNNVIYKICKTPGQLLTINTSTINQLFDLCKTVVTKAAYANYANTVSIITKINCKDNNDKFDLILFFNALEYAAKEEYIQTNSQQSFSIYLLTNEYKQMITGRAVSKESIMLSFLSKLYKFVR